MARLSRRVAASGFYHVTARGNGRQVIFESDEDRLRFLDLLVERLACGSVSSLAWCLMDNHIHLVLKDADGDMSGLMHGLCCSYAQYFNRRSGHVGHVFQGRFFSAPLETEAYFLDAVRYVHTNPAADGICPTETYRWSSYQEYLGVIRDGMPPVCDTGLVLGLTGGVDGFVSFHAASEGRRYRPRRGLRVPDDEVPELLLRTSRKLLGYEVAPAAVKALTRHERNSLLCAARAEGASVRQIARATGIGDSTVKRATCMR